jgi:hypothetical protein
MSSLYAVAPAAFLRFRARNPLDTQQTCAARRFAAGLPSRCDELDRWVRAVAAKGVSQNAEELIFVVVPIMPPV